VTSTGNGRARDRDNAPTPAPDRAYALLDATPDDHAARTVHEPYGVDPAPPAPVEHAATARLQGFPRGAGILDDEVVADFGCQFARTAIACATAPDGISLEPFEHLPLGDLLAGREWLTVLVGRTRDPTPPADVVLALGLSQLLVARRFQAEARRAQHARTHLLSGQVGMGPVPSGKYVEPAERRRATGFQPTDPSEVSLTAWARTPEGIAAMADDDDGPSDDDLLALELEEAEA
jgi:hypothetical protein